MANPYTNGDDMNPFAEELKEGAPRPAPAAAAAPTADVEAVRPSTPPTFYNPTSGGEATSAPQYNPTGDATFATQSPPQQQQQPHVAVQPQQQQQPDGTAQDGAGTQPARELATSKFWTLPFYQQFFDMNTMDVLKRMGNVLVPFSPPDFLQNREWHAGPTGPMGQALSDFSTRVSRNDQGEKPSDLYGPFWLATTFWITVGVVGNLVSRIEHTRQNKPGKWHYDFKEASVACVTVYVFVGLMSALVWGVMKWKAVPAAFQDVLCLYGYSIFIPLLAAILCGIPHTMFQWIVCLVCGCWSTFYLLANFWRLWRTTLAGPWFTGIVVLVVLAQIIFTCSLKFYFFNY